MDKHDLEARTDDLLRREAVRRRSGANVATSPQAVEAALASISDEVMEEAVARLNRAAVPILRKHG